MTDARRPPEQALASRPRDVKPGELGAEHHDPSLPPIGEHRAPGSHVGLLDVEEEVVAVVLAGSDEPAKPQPISTFKKLLGALLSFGALIGTAYAVPLEWAQPWRPGEGYIPFWNIIGRELMGEGAEAEQSRAEAERMAALAEQADAEELEGPVEPRKVIETPPPKDQPLLYPEYPGHEDDADEVEQALENSQALASFYASLTVTDVGYAGAVTHVGHWGDSVLGLDGITAAIRRRIQARFGDAGHGWHALKKYDSSYRQQGIRFAEKGGASWSSCFIRNRCMKEDNRYGYGGVTVWSSGGAESWFATETEGVVGLSASRFELWYQKRYKGGKLRVSVDGGASEQIIDTAIPLPEGVESLPPAEQPPPEDAWAVVEVPDGPHEFSVRAIGNGKARAYGVTLEREGPGVVWDGMALIGSFTSRLGEQDPEHLKAQLDHRSIDLMVFTFGGNDMTREQSDLRKTMDPYIEDYSRVIRLFRAAKPDAACLIMAPVDHGERVDGRVVSREIVPRMVEAQRQVALAEGCAFFDTYTAMGGDGSASRWKTQGLLSGDLAHPTSRGHKLLGSMLYRALMAGYVEFRKQQAGKPMPRELIPTDSGHQ